MNNGFLLIDMRELREKMKKDESKIPEIEIPEQSPIYQEMADLKLELFHLCQKLQNYDTLKQEYEQYKQDQELKYNTLKKEYDQYKLEHP
jgi:hypothetical protein